MQMQVFIQNIQIKSIYNEVNRKTYKIGDYICLNKHTGDKIKSFEVQEENKLYKVKIVLEEGLKIDLTQL
jgi:hypothetical protein